MNNKILLLNPLILFFLICGNFALQAQGQIYLGTGTHGEVRAITGYNGSLYAAGGFDSAGGRSVHNIARWDGSNWSALADSSGYGTSDRIYSLAVFQGELYAGGNFTSAGGKPVRGVAKWNGTRWASVGNGIQGNNTVYALSVFNGKLFAGGDFQCGSGFGIASWDGQSWQSAGSGVIGVVQSLLGDSDKLYVGGSFSTAGGVASHAIASWNDTSWSGVGGGLAAGARVMALARYAGRLFVGGSFDSAGGRLVNNIAAWNNQTWDSLESGITSCSGCIGQVCSLVVYDGKLCVGGQFTHTSGGHSQCLAVWADSVWIQFPTGGVYNNNNNITPYVNALCSFNGNLYIGGDFFYENIFEWGGPLGIPEPNMQAKFKAFPNPGDGLFTLTRNSEAQAEIQVFNGMGQVIYQSSFKGTVKRLDLSREAKGIYYYRLIGRNEIQGSGKLIVH